MVPRNSEIHSSQHAGRARKSCGRAEHELEAVEHRRHQQPDETHVVVQRQPRHGAVGVGELARRAMMASMFAPTQRSGSITPFGRRGRPARELQDGEAVGVVGRAFPCRGADRAHPRRRARRAAPPRRRSGGGSRNGARSRSTTTSAASALAMRRRVCSTNSSIEPRRIGSGSATTVPPARQIAWMAVDERPRRRPEHARRARRGPRRGPGARRPCPGRPRGAGPTRPGRRAPASPAAEPTKVIVPGPSAAVWRRETTEGISSLDSCAPARVTRR